MLDLEFRSKGLFSCDYDVRHRGRRIAVLDRAAFRERASFEFEDVEYELRSRGLGGGKIQLLRGDDVIARATRRSIWTSAYDIEAAMRRAPGGPGSGAEALARGEVDSLSLTKPSIWSSRYEIHRGRRRIGGIGKASVWGSTAKLHLREDFSLPLAVFLGYVVITLWNRQNSTAAAGAGGAVVSG